MCVLDQPNQSIPLYLLQQSSLLTDSMALCQSNESTYFLWLFLASFNFFELFFVLNPEYADSFGIISILFKNSESELKFEEINALAMIDNDRTDRRVPFMALQIF